MPHSNLTAELYDSQFPLSHDTYNGLTAASDGCVYYTLCTESFDTGAVLFKFDPAARAVTPVLDLTEACGEAGIRAVPQGKCHVTPEEHDGKLYFATHVGVYSALDGREMMPIPPAGYQEYPGGHFLVLDLATGKSTDLGKVPNGEGILTMALDGPRRRAYGITWPTGEFVALNIESGEIRMLGRISAEGEAGIGPTFRTLCRSLRVDPADGSVYFTVAEGWIFRYRFDAAAPERLTADDLRKDYFGLYEPSSPGHMGYNWRQTVWYEPEQAIYGVHGNSGYLFRFDPREERVDVIERLTAEPSRRAGMFDQFSYGYLGFTLGPNGRTIYYLTGGALYENGRRVRGKDSTAKGEAKGSENLHLVTFDLETRTYRDHGSIQLPNGDRPSYVNSITVDRAGWVYALTRVRTGEPAAPSDLMRVRPAL